MSHASFPGAMAAAWVIFILMLGWYLAQQTLWFRTKLQTSLARGFGHALGAALVAQFLIILTAVAVVLAGQSK